jgi:farnesyl diphosphate synthase/geranylgeranyl diphosphate synthase type II
VADRSSVAGAFDSSVVAEVEAHRRQIDESLARVCETELTAIDASAPRVADAIRYSLLGGGKRFRGILFLAAYRAAGGDDDATMLAAAIEIVHAYSLVHDDLPCMDDDDVRRGRPTVHRKFDTRTATVAGLTMVPLAARTSARAARSLPNADARRVVAEMMSAAGGGGMIGGQLLDLEGEGKPLSLPDLEQIHRAKTGALVSAAALLGGVAAGASDSVIEALSRYGAALGLAFQIADDVLDVTGSTEMLGKTAGRDVELQKSTYPALLGIPGATRRAEALVDDGCAALSEAGLLTPLLESIARFVVRRSS